MHPNIFATNLVTHSSIDPSFLEGYQIFLQKTSVTVGASMFTCQVIIIAENMHGYMQINFFNFDFSHGSLLCLCLCQDKEALTLDLISQQARDTLKYTSSSSMKLLLNFFSICLDNLSTLYNFILQIALWKHTTFVLINVSNVQHSGSTSRKGGQNLCIGLVCLSPLKSSLSIYCHMQLYKHQTTGNST